jgi:hypothetical protein
MLPTRLAQESTDRRFSPASKSATSPSAWPGKAAKARQMYEAGLANVSIKDEAGHQIDGDELLDCIMGKKRSPKT